MEESANSLMTTQESLFNTQNTQAQNEDAMRHHIEQVQTQIKYYREKSDNYKEACEWLQKKLLDAEETIAEKEKMINTFENI